MHTERRIQQGQIDTEKKEKRKKIISKTDEHTQNGGIWGWWNGVHVCAEVRWYVNWQPLNGLYIWWIYVLNRSVLVLHAQFRPSADLSTCTYRYRLLRGWYMHIPRGSTYLCKYKPKDWEPPHSTDLESTPPGFVIVNMWNNLFCLDSHKKCFSKTCWTSSRSQIEYIKLNNISILKQVKMAVAQILVVGVQDFI